MRRVFLLPFFLATATALAGCVDEEVIYRPSPLIPELPSNAASFVGYGDQEDKLTICGNCHVGQQEAWEGTAHARAWESLEADGAQDNPACQSCHSTNALGNPMKEDGGFTTTKNSRYQDVQCEACHGPGLGHIQRPDGLQPLAPVRVDTALTYGCGECHRGQFSPFVEEWASSAHGRMPNSAYPASRAECQSCHAGEASLQQIFGVRAVYLEKDSLGTAKHLAITCAICHDPHDATFKGQLRKPVDAPNEEENLCMQCHHKRGNPDPTTFRGPHSPEGPVLLGYGGWWPPNMEFPGGDTIRATHGGANNPRLCAGCHVNRYQVKDPSGKVIGNSVGHTFQAIPCLDAQGRPTTEDCELQERSFQACASCHSPEAARSLMLIAENRLDDLATELEALLKRVPATEFNDKDNRYSTAEGSRFNAELARYPGTAVHNPFLVEALLTASIRQVRQDYGLAAQSNVSLKNVLPEKNGR